MGDEVLLEHAANLGLVIDYQDCGFGTHGYDALPRINPLAACSTPAVDR
jgi:hypothetical protein